MDYRQIANITNVPIGTVMFAAWRAPRRGIEIAMAEDVEGELR